MIALIAPVAAKGSFRGHDGVIAYSSKGAIWVVDPVSRGQLQLTSGFDDSFPSFSPSGDLLAFQRRHGAATTIYIARADGSEAKPLVKGSQPGFSPNGHEIVFVRKSGLFTVGLMTGARLRQITRQPGDRTPQWSLSGQIVFERTNVRREHRGGETYVAFDAALDTITPPDSRITTILSYNQDVNMWPNWSPDGKSLAIALCLSYSSLAGRIPGLTSLRVLAHPSCEPADWAPEGRLLDEAGTGPLAGQPGTSCPADRKGETGPFSWQPLHPGTIQVPTLSCKRIAEAPNEGPPAGGPPPPPGTKICFMTRAHHRSCIALDAVKPRLVRGRSRLEL